MSRTGVAFGWGGVVRVNTHPTVLRLSKMIEYTASEKRVHLGKVVRFGDFLYQPST